MLYERRERQTYINITQGTSARKFLGLKTASNMEDKILKALEEKPLRPGQIAEATGLSKEEVSAALKKLKAEGKVDSPIRCHYGLVK